VPLELVLVIGTRAQLVKMAPVALAAKEAGVDATIHVTAQHLDSMIDLACDLGIGDMFPAAELAVERKSIFGLVSWLPSALWRATRALARPAGRRASTVVLVHGDTLSTLIGALAARIAGLTVAHVESGLTSGALFDPFPEEVTRRLVFRLAHIAFCPDDLAADHMAAAHPGVQVVRTPGNTVIDALRIAMRHQGQAARATADGYGVVSLHRFENIMPTQRLRTLADAVSRVAATLPLEFVLHPATEARLRQSGLLDGLANAPGVRLRPRMPYTSFMALAGAAEVVITDGGSNQEELSILGVPTVVMRARTERRDGIGANVILEPDLPVGVVEYLRGGHYRALRRPSALSVVGMPSARIIQYLLDRAGRAP
jgi:UDP-N-acetylglucosamine 2-epimerase (non-hydrolysing)